jgi:hypothetical protein
MYQYLGPPSFVSSHSDTHQQYMVYLYQCKPPAVTGDDRTAPVKGPVGALAHGTSRFVVVLLLYLVPSFVLRLFPAGRRLRSRWGAQVRGFAVSLFVTLLSICYVPVINTAWQSLDCVDITCPSGTEFFTKHTFGDEFKVPLWTSTRPSLSTPTVGIGAISAACEVCPYTQSCSAFVGLCGGGSSLRLRADASLSCNADILPYYAPVGATATLYFALLVPVAVAVIVHYATVVVNSTKLTTQQQRQRQQRQRQQRQQRPSSSSSLPSSSSSAPPPALPGVLGPKSERWALRVQVSRASSRTLLAPLERGHRFHDVLSLVRRAVAVAAALLLKGGNPSTNVTAVVVQFAIHAAWLVYLAVAAPYLDPFDDHVALAANAVLCLTAACGVVYAASADAGGLEASGDAAEVATPSYNVTQPVANANSTFVVPSGTPPDELSLVFLLPALILCVVLPLLGAMKRSRLFAAAADALKKRGPRGMLPVIWGTGASASSTAGGGGGFGDSNSHRRSNISSNTLGSTMGARSPSPPPPPRSPRSPGSPGAPGSPGSPGGSRGRDTNDEASAKRLREKPPSSDRVNLAMVSLSTVPFFAWAYARYRTSPHLAVASTLARDTAQRLARRNDPHQQQQQQQSMMASSSTGGSFASQVDARASLNRFAGLAAGNLRAEETGHNDATAAATTGGDAPPKALWSRKVRPPVATTTAAGRGRLHGHHQHQQDFPLYAAASTSTPACHAPPAPAARHALLPSIAPSPSLSHSPKPTSGALAVEVVPGVPMWCVLRIQRHSRGFLARRSLETSRALSAMDARLERSAVRVLGSAFFVIALCSALALVFVTMGAVVANEASKDVPHDPERISSSATFAYEHDLAGLDDWPSFASECCCRDGGATGRFLATEVWECASGVVKQRARVERLGNGSVADGTPLRPLCALAHAPGICEPFYEAPPEGREGEVDLALLRTDVCNARVYNGTAVSNHTLSRLW